MQLSIEKVNKELIINSDMIDNLEQKSIELKNKLKILKIQNNAMNNEYIKMAIICIFLSIKKN